MPIRRKLKKRLGLKSLDLKYTGSQPTFFDVTFKDESDKLTQMIFAFNWYNYWQNSKDRLFHILNYMKDASYGNDEIRHVSCVNPQFTTSRVSVLYQMSTNGFELSKEDIVNMKLDVLKLIEIGKSLDIKKEQPKKVSTYKPNPQKFLKDKVDKLVISEIEAQVDTWEETGWKHIPVIDLIRKHKIKPTAFKFIIEYLNEIKHGYDSKDKQLIEAYSHVSKKEQKKRIQFCKGTIDEINLYGKSVKVSRVPRKRKSVSVNVTNLIKKVKHQQQDKYFNITSVPAAEIVGSQCVILFNTKYKVMVLLRAAIGDRLSLKGTSVVGFDVDTSIKKSIRKPKEVLIQVLNKSLVATKKLLKNLKTKDQSINGRLNEQTIILRVFK